MTQDDGDLLGRDGGQLRLMLGTEVWRQGAKDQRRGQRSLCIYLKETRDQVCTVPWDADEFQSKEAFEEPP